MHLTPREKDTFHIVAIILVIFVGIASIVGAFWFGNAARLALRTQLGERSQSIAAALGPSQIAQLNGDASDAGTAVYSGLKTTLAEVKAANPDARSVYIMGKRDDQLFFYVDSEQPTSDQYSAAGEQYDDGTAEDSAIFNDGKAFVEGPTTDSYGSFISGIAPIFDEKSHSVLAVVGIDIDSETYWRSIVMSSLIPLLIGTTIILILLVFERIRRHNSQLLALRSELVSVASHELRSPITGIRWAAESVLTLGTSEPRIKKMIQAILDSALRLQASTNDILELSHATNGRSLKVKPTDLSALMHEIVDTQALSAQQKEVTLVFDQYWPAKLTINCDPDQMRRALHNVLSNAIKYTKNGTAVTISYQQAAKTHNILVTDQGIGIPASEQNKVFRGFYRASNAVKSDIPGTGLGLYLVKTVLQRHGGSVSFASQQDKGTTFTLTLPR